MQSSEGPTNSSSVISLREGICGGFKSLVSSTANKLKSHLRRLFMAETVQQ
ncbi:MAG: hypothetical protein AB9866_15950 [Syntrophobacteraceae bacterium]